MFSFLGQKLKGWSQHVAPFVSSSSRRWVKNVATCGVLDPWGPRNPGMSGGSPLLAPRLRAQLAPDVLEAWKPSGQGGLVFQCVCVLQGQYGQNIWFGENSTISDVRIGWWSQFFRDGWNESKSSQEWPCSTTLPASLYSVTFTEYHRLLFSLQLQKQPVVSKMSCVHPCNVFPSPKSRDTGNRRCSSTNIVARCHWWGKIMGLERRWFPVWGI
jgi:hypothetical protein